MRATDLLDRPIAFHRCFVTLTDSITAALLLSQIIYWSKRTKSADGWFYKTAEEWKDETGLTRHEQETAREKLRKIGVLHEERRGAPAKLFYKLDCDNLENLIARISESSLPESGKLKCEKEENKKREKSQTYKETETTTENTSEREEPLSLAEPDGEEEGLPKAIKDVTGFVPADLRDEQKLWALAEKLRGQNITAEMVRLYAATRKSQRPKMNFLYEDILQWDGVRESAVSANHLRLVDQMPDGLDEFGKVRWLKEQLAKGAAA